MSKAFTKEGDGDQDERDDAPDPVDPLPKGVKNYITPGGEQRLRSELKDLLYTKRPEVVSVVAWAASNGDRSENADYIYGKRRLREIDRRIRFLTKRLENAEVIDPSQFKSERVHFGATVRVVDENGKEKTFSIVGVDEIDAKNGRISWVSPMGKALLKAKVGDAVTVQTPKGQEDLKILEIRYEALPKLTEGE